jgi:hypothetical protein
MVKFSEGFKSSVKPAVNRRSTFFKVDVMRLKLVPIRELVQAKAYAKLAGHALFLATLKTFAADSRHPGRGWRRS